MVQLSVDLFLAATFATGLAAVLYAAHAFGAWVVLRQAGTDMGATVTVASRVGMPAWVGRLGALAAWTALALLSASLAARTIATGRPPYTNMWEYQVAFGWAILFFYVLFERWQGQRDTARALGAFVLPVALTLLLVSYLFFPSDVEPLVPALQYNFVLGLHVGTMILAYGALAISFGAGLMYLVQGPRGRFPRLPRPSSLEEMGYRSVLVGFPLLALGIALGAYWGDRAWGRYWGWDPKETSALVTWLIYAGYLHLRGLRGWRGYRSAWLLVLGFLAILFTYFAVNLWVSGLHSYAGI